jgi:dihydroneopterin aldolase
MEKLDWIEVTGMRMESGVGVQDIEWQLKRTLEIDVYVYYKLVEAARSDDVESTVNYGEVYHIVREVVQQQPARLLEHLMGEIARRLHDRYPAHQGIVIRMVKVYPFVQGQSGMSGARMHFSHGELSRGL